MWNLKRNDTNELTYKIERDSQTQENQHMIVRGWGKDGEGIVRGFQMDMYTLLYLK